MNSECLKREKMFPRVAVKAIGIILSLCVVCLDSAVLCAAESIAVSANPQTGEFTPVKAFKTDQTQASQDPQAGQKDDALAVAPPMNLDDSPADSGDAFEADELFSRVSDLLMKGSASEGSNEKESPEQEEYLYEGEIPEAGQALQYSDWENLEIALVAGEELSAESAEDYENLEAPFEYQFDDIREDLNKGISVTSLMQQLEDYLSLEKKSEELSADETGTALIQPEPAEADEEIFFIEEENEAKEEVSYEEAKEKMALNIMGEETAFDETEAKAEKKAEIREIDAQSIEEEMISPAGIPTVESSVSLNAISRASTQTVLAPLMTATASAVSQSASMDSLMYKSQAAYQPQFSNLLNFDPLKSQKQETSLFRAFPTSNSPFMSRSAFDPTVFSLRRDSFLSMTPLVGEEKVPVLYRTSVHLKRWYSLMTKRAIGVNRQRQSARYTYRFGADEV